MPWAAVSNVKTRQPSTGFAKSWRRRATGGRRWWPRSSPARRFRRESKVEEAMLSGRRLSRRAFLHGFGASISLPFLDAMSAPFARAATAKAPCRMAFVYVPNGVMLEDWIPQTEGDTAPLPSTLPRILNHLNSWHDRILLMSGLTQNGGRALGDGGGDHARASASYLTSVHPKKTYGVDLKAGISVDQIAAQQVGNQTRFASLELGCEE